MSRYFMLLIVFVQIIAAAAILLRVPFVLELWQFPNTTPLSFMFIASIFAVAAASTLWCLFAKEDGALAGIGLDYLVILTPLALFSFQVGSSTGSNGLIVYGVSCVLGALFGLYLLQQTRNIPITPTPPMPALVRISFIVFVIALIIAGGALVLKTPNILPWSVTPELSVVCGWMFIGAAAYFAYAVLRPSWHNAAGQLAGFLAYDVVLILPFLQRLPTIAPELRLSLYIYTAVVTYSGLLAIYYLFINRGTRITGS
jgi:hypothetical protein